MKPIKFPGFTHDFGKPAGWDDDVDGKCGSLPLMLHDRLHISTWKLSFRERLRILFGWKVTLSCHGLQPPVMLDVQRVRQIE